MIVDCVVRIWIIFASLMLVFVFCSSMIGEAWTRMREYEDMKKRGFTLLKDEKGEDFWVGYGD